MIMTFKDCTITRITQLYQIYNNVQLIAGELEFEIREEDGSIRIESVAVVPEQRDVYENEYFHEQYLSGHETAARILEEMIRGNIHKEMTHNEILTYLGRRLGNEFIVTKGLM